MDRERGRKPSPEDDPWAVAERRSRALEEPLDTRLERRTPFPVLEVRNPLHRTAYLVLLPEFPDRSIALCTCADFARRGLGTCKHIEAAGRWLERHPEAVPRAATPSVDTGPIWEEIDRRLARLDVGASAASLAWRLPGGTLVDRAPPPWVEERPREEEGVRRGGGIPSSRPTSRERP
jgi:hypothetical protein